MEPDEPEETVHVHSVAADPGGGAAADERPDEGYASEELDELGGFIDEPDPVDERDESADAELEQQDLEELEQQLAGVVVQAAPGTAASAEAAADAAIKKLRRGQHTTPPSKPQRRRPWASEGSSRPRREARPGASGWPRRGVSSWFWYMVTLVASGVYGRSLHYLSNDCASRERYPGTSEENLVSIA